jgi:pimeloyl-ACP methyl ester carboxylesterase
VPDADVQAAIDHWAPRFIQNGVDYNDFVRTVSHIDTWDEWLPEWARTADEQADFAREAEQAGHTLTAGHAWRRAAINRHFGKFVWMVDLGLAERATHQVVQEYNAALRLLDPTAERVECPIGEGTAVANLRHPRNVEVAPYVVLIPGLDSTKEEFFYLEEAFLDRGMATASLDGPGQGETGLTMPIRADYEVAVSSLLDVLADRSDLDHHRIGLCGTSLGGYYAPRAAAFEPRARAVVGISGPFCFGDMWDDLPPKSGARDDAEGHRLASTLDLEGVCQRIDVPALYVTGAKDRLIPWQQTQRQADETPQGTFVNYPEGSHGVSNMPYRARPVIADWMADHLL